MNTMKRPLVSADVDDEPVIVCDKDGFRHSPDAVSYMDDGADTGILTAPGVPWQLHWTRGEGLMSTPDWSVCVGDEIWAAVQAGTLRTRPRSELPEFPAVSGVEETMNR